MRLPFEFRRRLRFLLIGAGLCLGVSAQDQRADERVQLPKYVVTGERELPPPEQWLYARIPGFEVLSNASERSTRELLTNFQSFANAVSLVWPGMGPRTSAPASLIVCGRADQFSSFLPATERGAAQSTISATFRSREQASIVLDLQTKELSVTATLGAGAVSAPTATEENDTASDARGDPGVAVDAHQELYREYLRFLLSEHEAKPPAWFTEGLAQLFMAMDVTSTSITLGKLEDPNLGSQTSRVAGGAQLQSGDFNTALARRALIPLEEMFAPAPELMRAQKSIGSAWAKQCYLFVHWGLYGDEGAHQKDFLTFVGRLQREPATDALYKECFRKSYEEMLFTLRSYLEMTRHKIAGVRAEKGQKLPEPPPVVLREATEAEVGRLKGEALLLAGDGPAAHTAMIVPYVRGERDPALLAALGLKEADGGDLAKARKLLEAAAANKVVRPRAYLELARLRLTESLARPDGGRGKLSVEQTASVLGPLFIGQAQSPALAEIFGLMAEAWSHSAYSPTADHLAAVEVGVKLFPRDTALIYRAAELRGKTGFLQESHRLIRLGLRVAGDDATRAKFEKLQARLSPLTADHPK